MYLCTYISIYIYLIYTNEVVNAHKSLNQIRRKRLRNIFDTFSKKVIVKKKKKTFRKIYFT